MEGTYVEVVRVCRLNILSTDETCRSWGNQGDMQ